MQTPTQASDRPQVVDRLINTLLQRFVYQADLFEKIKKTFWRGTRL